MAPNRRQAVIWTNADPVHWRIYAALGGDELKLPLTDDNLSVKVLLHFQKSFSKYHRMVSDWNDTQRRFRYRFGDKQKIRKCRNDLFTKVIDTFWWMASVMMMPPVRTSNRAVKSATWFLLTHDDVIKWKHFPRNWPCVHAGNSPVPVKSPHKGQWRGALMFSLICFWINGWVNNREAGDLRRYLGHYDVIVMKSKIICWRQSFLTKGTYTLRWIFSTGFIGALYVLKSVHVNITQND